MTINDLKNKIIVITGASAGVGRATAKAFAKHGSQIVLIARGEEGLAGAKQDVEQLGGRAFSYPCDVANATALCNITEKIENEIGPIDVWVNNAMCSVFSPVAQVTPQEYERVTHVTYLGQVYGTLAVLKPMSKRNKGKIILIGSALAYRGIPLQSAYCAAKHAIEGFFESLRCELIHDKSNIQLTMIQLPAMNTPQFDWVLNKLPNKPRPMGKVYTSEVAARAIVFATTHNRRQVYVGYPTFETIIGNKFFPGWLDKYLARIGYKGQQTSEKKDPTQPNNVWQAVDTDIDKGPDGHFRNEASNFSIALWMVMHRSIVWITLCIIILIIISSVLYEYII